MWTRSGGAELVGEVPGRWIDAVAASGSDFRIVAGLDDGRVWTATLTDTPVDMLKAEKGPPITALAVSPDGSHAAWGDEAGSAGVVELG